MHFTALHCTSLHFSGGVLKPTFLYKKRKKEPSARTPRRFARVKSPRYLDDKLHVPEQLPGQSRVEPCRLPSRVALTPTLFSPLPSSHDEPLACRCQQTPHPLLHAGLLTRASSRRTGSPLLPVGSSAISAPTHASHPLPASGTPLDCDGFHFPSSRKSTKPPVSLWKVEERSQEYG